MNFLIRWVTINFLRTTLYRGVVQFETLCCNIVERLTYCTCYDFVPLNHTVPKNYQGSLSHLCPTAESEEMTTKFSLSHTGMLF